MSLDVNLIDRVTHTPAYQIACHATAQRLHTLMHVPNDCLASPTVIQAAYIIRNSRSPGSSHRVTQ